MVLLHSFQSHSQNQLGTGDDGFLVQITSPSSIAQVLSNGSTPGICQWIGQKNWGADVTDSFCGEVVWADDSLACSPLPNNSALLGKIALIRRGDCSFSLKTYHAQLAGAKAVVILNHYANALDGPCETYENAAHFLGQMIMHDSAAAVNIPAIFLERKTGEDITSALDAGQNVTICFTFPRMRHATSASMYATPYSQVDTMNSITVIYNNRSGAVQTDVNLKAEIFNPSGNLVGTLNYNMPTVSPNVDSFIVFEPFYADPAYGKHTVMFTNDHYSEGIDTLYSYFQHTVGTFATDNLKVLPWDIAPIYSQQVDSEYSIQSAGVCYTGNSDIVVTHVTFGIANAADVFIPGGDSENTMLVILYKADVDDDGVGDLVSNISNDLAPGLIGYAEYQITGDEVVNQLILVPLTEIHTGVCGMVPLEAKSVYYISLIADGTLSPQNKTIRFTTTADVAYADRPNYPTTPLNIGPTFHSGWQGTKVVQRLEEFYYDPTAEPTLLSNDKVKITPNPANEFVNVNLDLAGVNPSVAVSIIDNRGRLVGNTQVQKNFQQGVLNFNVQQLPSGTYYVWVRSAEGSTMKPVAICH